MFVMSGPGSSPDFVFMLMDRNAKPGVACTLRF